MTNSSQKLLSIVMTGCDDDYMPDFRYRITTTLNHFARNLYNLNRIKDVEILVTDWGSQVPMAQTLDLSPEASLVSRLIYVPPKLIDSIQRPNEGFNVSRALNVAIRRATGRFIMSILPDQLLLEYSVYMLLRFLEGKFSISQNLDQTMMIIPRLSVPWQFLERRPDLHEWDRFLVLNEFSLDRIPIADSKTFIGAGGFIMHNQGWRRLRGHNEEFSGRGGHDLDFGFRSSQNYPGLWLTSVGVLFFHMDHPPTGRRASAILKPSPNFYTPALQANSDTWGLGELKLDLQSPTVQSPAAKLTTTQPHTTAESWPCSTETVISELYSDKVHKNVMRIYKHFLIKGWCLDQSAIDAIFFVSWYGLYRYPRRYLEFGANQGHSFCAVACACPCVEAYIIDRWEGVLSGPTPYDLSFVSSSIGYRGYLRFVNGDMGTAVQRLRDSFIGPFNFDLILVRGERCGSGSLEQVSSLVPDLNAGGALVFTECSEDKFNVVWNEIQKQFPDCTYFQSADSTTGMLLVAHVQDDAIGASRAINTEVIFKKGWFAFLTIGAKVFYPLLPVLRLALRIARRVKHYLIKLY